MAAVGFFTQCRIFCVMFNSFIFIIYFFTFTKKSKWRIDTKFILEGKRQTISFRSRYSHANISSFQKDHGTRPSNCRTSWVRQPNALALYKCYKDGSLRTANGFWPGLGLPRPKAIVVIPKNQPLPKHLRKKRVKSTKHACHYATKKKKKEKKTRLNNNVCGLEHHN